MKKQKDTPHIKTKELPNNPFLAEIIKLLNEGHTVTISLKGYSMRPFLENERDKAVLTKAVELRVGDVGLAMINHSYYVLHRIIDIRDNTVTLRGDGNIATETCSKDDVSGIALGFYRKGRNRLDSTKGLKWKIYSHIWVRLFPVRSYLLALYRRIWIPLFGPI